MDDIQGMDVFAEGKRIWVLLIGKVKGSAATSSGYSYSVDGGKSWVKPEVISLKTNSPIISRRGNDGQVAVHDENLVAVWQRQGDTPGGGPLTIAYSRDGGKRWSHGIAPARRDPTHNQSYFDLAVDRAGTFHLVWLDDREESGTSQGLRYARSIDAGRTWRDEVTIDQTACTCCWNRLSVWSAERLAVLYRDDDPHDMRLALRSGPHGAWQSQAAVGGFNWKITGCPHCGGGLTVSGSQDDLRLHSVVWTGKENSEGLYYLRSLDEGKHWQSVMRLSDSGSKESDIAAHGPGALGAIFTGLDGDRKAFVGFRYSSDGGNTWSDPRSLSTNQIGRPDHPRLVPALSGFRAFWTEQTPEGRKVLATKFVQALN